MKYANLTASQLWQAVAECGAGEMVIGADVVAALLRATEPLKATDLTDNDRCPFCGSKVDYWSDEHDN